jgi:hypothetical protein
MSVILHFGNNQVTRVTDIKATITRQILLDSSQKQQTNAHTYLSKGKGKAVPL